MYYKTKHGWAPTAPERKSLPLAGYPYSSATSSNFLSSLGSASYASLYRNDMNVFAAVNKLAHYVARLPLKVYQPNDNGDRDRVRRHPLAQLLANPYEGGDAFSFWVDVVRSVAIHGEAAVALIRPRAGAAPNQLVPIVPGQLKAVHANGEVIAYQWHQATGVEPRTLSPEDVMHFRLWGGVSPLEPLRKTLELEDRAQRYAIANFDNAARPSGILTINEDLDEDDLAGVRAQLNARHGGPDNAFKVAVLNAAAKWEPFSHTAQQAELIAHRQLAVEAVCRVYDIPAPLLNDLEHATYSNIETLERSFYKGTLTPWLSMIEGVIASQLIARERSFRNVFVEFDLNAVVQGSLSERGTAYMQLTQAAVYTTNELRARENLPRIEDPRADRPGGFFLNMGAAEEVSNE